MPKYSISQTQLIAGISKFLERKCRVTSVLPRQFNAIIKAADLIVDELGRDEILCADGAGIRAWLASDQTGASSLYMAWIFRIGPVVAYAEPRDADDFGRCLGLLRAVPELREQLPLMRSTGPAWAKIVDHWDELESLYIAGRRDELNALLSLETARTHA